jgi:NADH dehydrogenase [ubiquinone] 1 alpha subcomplex assembly factor 7
VSALAVLLRQRIEAEGPLEFAEFMAAALGTPGHGYYMTADPFGVAGDFITAPEISQTFGELIGAWCADIWERSGRPQQVSLVELGPGRGTLMADALRILGKRPAFLNALTPRLVETSPALRERQKQALTGTGATWHTRFEDLPDEPKIIIANEFFDALPVHRFLRTEAGWAEQLVDIDPETAAFRLVLANRESAQAALIPKSVIDSPVGSAAEVSAAGQALTRHIARDIVERGSAALIIDYGPEHSAPGDSVQAVRRHRPVDPLADPGNADITAHVDFEALAGVADEAGAQSFGPISQGTFLRRLGIELRTMKLMGAATPERARDIAAGTRRLIESDQMGTLFKALALVGPGQPPPAGFEARSEKGKP